MTQTVDVSGLPEAVVEDIQRLVASIRVNMPFPSRTDAKPALVSLLEAAERELDAMGEDMPTLPADFCRADIYNGHD